MNNIIDINVLSDKALLQKIGYFIQQTRIKQNMTQNDLAKKATISRSMLSLIERGDNISLVNLIKILRILDALYVLINFDITEELSPIQLAKGEKQPRKRASKISNPNTDTEDLGW
ncbi:helix-turn-helix transcriptional regulator [Flavobacterium sp. xlx-214]|uniref:helix-turn-helix domain-containing protein n=1 Tax=unclassified Flavobacterium TaxID=196869 RepID=UPI0013D2790F|nr:MULTISPECIES: helix-turn-helix transcriptional regulator [unclassified Flavobacterium]MBA5793790.1 helix-turn-helix transcriptional regulator [Flavobacterium sp. xlx-221]QMI83190.1 helix-turn-helix transcriptional regulator [Flavobacterium sp. xlx-214]